MQIGSYQSGIQTKTIYYLSPTANKKLLLMLCYNNLTATRYILITTSIYFNELLGTIYYLVQYRTHKLEYSLSSLTINKLI